MSLGKGNAADFDVPVVESPIPGSVRTNVPVTSSERSESKDEGKVGDDKEKVDSTETDDDAGYAVALFGNISSE